MGLPSIPGTSWGSVPSANAGVCSSKAGAPLGTPLEGVGISPRAGVGSPIPPAGNPARGASVEIEFGSWINCPSWVAAFFASLKWPRALCPIAEIFPVIDGVELALAMIGFAGTAGIGGTMPEPAAVPWRTSKELELGIHFSEWRRCDISSRWRTGLVMAPIARGRDYRPFSMELNKHECFQHGQWIRRTWERNGQQVTEKR